MGHIGLVLSGGMGKGAYQIGALTAIQEFFRPQDFEYVSAASIGALNTYAFLTGNLEKARKMWEEANLQGNRRFITSVLKSGFLQEVVAEIASDVPIANSFYVPLVDLQHKQLEYYNLGNVAPDEMRPYLEASVAMPFYNKGVVIGGRTLYDGAMIDNIPICPVLEKDLDYVICIYFDDLNYIFENNSYDNKVIKLIFPDSSIISHSVCIEHEFILNMIEEGYNGTRRVLGEVFSDGVDDLERIYARIADRNQSETKKTIRITGDIVVTNMNKIAKKFFAHNHVWEEMP